MVGMVARARLGYTDDYLIRGMFKLTEPGAVSKLMSFFNTINKMS